MVGAISLVLALYSLSVISVNWLGVLLIALGVLLFVLEMVTPTFGILSIAGVGALAFGSVVLIEPGSPYGEISLAVMIPTVLFSAAFFFGIAYIGLKAQRGRSKTGGQGMVGDIGEARSDIAPEGKVYIDGEWWDAKSDTPIGEGQKVRVVKVEGMMLTVEPIIK